MLILNACFRASAVLVGGFLVAAQITLNLESLREPDPLTGVWLVAIAVPCATAIAFLVMERCWVERRYAMACVAFLAFLLGASYTFTFAVERGVSVREDSARSRSNHGYDLTMTALNDARSRVRVLEADVAREAQTGCGPRCRKAKADLADAQARVFSLQDRLAEIGTPHNEKALSQRYGRTAELVDQWQPVVLALVLELMGSLLICFGLGGARSEPAPKPKQTVLTSAIEGEIDEGEGDVIPMADYFSRKHVPGDGPAIAAFSFRK